MTGVLIVNGTVSISNLRRPRCVARQRKRRSPELSSFRVERDAMRSSPARVRFAATSCASIPRVVWKVTRACSATCNTCSRVGSRILASTPEPGCTIKEGHVLRALSFILGLAVAASFSTMAGACGQLAPIEATKPGHLIYVRGYGYGFEGGTR